MPSKEYIGREVSKWFPGHGNFTGKVTSVDSGDRKYPYHVTYADGDEEDISEKELVTILVSRKSPRQRGRPSKEGEQGRVASQAGEADGENTVARLLHSVQNEANRAQSNDIVRRGPSSGGLDGPSRYSQVVVYGSVAHLAGQTASDTSSRSGKSYGGQTQQVLKQIDQLLRAVGSNKSRILRALVHLKDVEAGAADFNKAWDAWVDSQNLPARTTVQAPMIRPEFLVEITVDAALALS